ncbi:glycosyltransferase family 2 protein [Taibaiella soli]|uniref:Glycosyltransferase 2-like domain-containing protein n=1 Tax=Taibaiella soli TaxID=1649169 RepID=A0A2W2AGU1_9BACT|nr:glycosyltransferase family 2 protein [Taibaiella soli]PZF74491.1 hypothetical protein DN068_02625 [Taibaiella soli]
MPDAARSTIRFSVIIPAYNAAKTIVRAIESCLQQSYPPAEIIVVNDASSDDTEQVILADFNDRIRYISLTKNRGAGGARNEGLKLATGDFIAFQDADDVWHKDKLQLIADQLSQNASIRFLYHPYTLSSVDYDARKRTFSTTKYPLKKLLWSNPIGTPCTVLINDGKLRFNEDMRYMEDFDLWLRAGDKYGIWFLDLPLTQINRPILSEGGLSSNRWRMRKGEIKAYIHLSKRNPLYYPLLPFLIGFGLFKHFIKSFSPPRSNY